LISLNLLKFRSAVLRRAVIGKLSLEWPQAVFQWASAEIDNLLTFFRLLTM